MNSIYTSNGTLVVQHEMATGVRKFVKQANGVFEGFYRAHTQEKFRKTAWGKRAERDFHAILAAVKKELAE